MKVWEFERWLRMKVRDDLLRSTEAVETFREAGYTDKPYGLKVQFEDGSIVWVQFVRTSPPGGEPASSPDYYGVKS